MVSRTCPTVITLLITVVVAVVAGAVTPALDEARRLIEEKRYAEADSLARAALAAIEAALGEGSLETAEALDLVVESRSHGGKIYDSEAKLLAERAVEIKERHLDGDDPRLAASLHNLAALLQVEGDFDGARAVADRALAIREQAFGPDDPQVANSLYLLGVIADLQRTDEAVSFFERCLAIREKRLDPDDFEIGDAAHRLGNAYHDTGRPIPALPCFEKAVAVKERALGPKHPSVGSGYYMLGHTLIDLGDYERGIDHCRHGLAIYEEASGLDSPDFAWGLGYVAMGLLSIGEYAEAVSLVDRMHAINEKALDPEDAKMGYSFFNVGMARYYVGDLPAARAAFETASDILSRSRWRGARPARTNLGLVYLAQGDCAAARALAEGAIATAESAGAHDDEDVHVAWGVQMLGSALYCQGDYAGAREQFARALAIRERAVGAAHPDLAEDLRCMAKVHSRTGEHALARAEYERGLEILERTLGPDHADVAGMLRDLGGCQLALGDRRGALDCALRAEDIGRNHLRLTTRALSENLALGYAAVRIGGLDLALAMVANGGIDATDLHRVWDAEIRSRAVVLDEIGARRRGIAGAGDPEIDSLAAAVQASRRRLANLSVGGPGHINADDYRRLIEDAQRQREATEHALAARSAPFAAELARTRIGLDEVLAAVPRGSALVAYCRYGDPAAVQGPELGDSLTSTRSALGAGCYLAFIAVTGSADHVQAVSLGPAVAIDEAVARWRREAPCARESTDGGRRSEAAYRLAGDALRQLVWDPVAARIAGAERVLLVPDGALHLVSFAALPLGSESYLVEQEVTFHRLSAERDLVRDDDQEASGTGLLLVADPDYERAAGPSPSLLAAANLYRGSRSACGDLTQLRFERLPGTRAEARELERVWRQARANEQVVTLAGAHADEQRVTAAMCGKRVVHVATHGFLAGQGCESALDGHRGVGAVEDLIASARPVVASGENPLLLAGLALAGANRRAEAGPDEEDGILTAEEVGALDLRGVEWAVLSGCDTGRGELRAGEGVLGLGRAFQVAGARTLIMSLWPVEDEAGAAWMQALYEARFTRGLDTASAMREASLALLRARRAAGASTHPSAWGAFVASGDWR